MSLDEVHAMDQQPNTVKVAEDSEEKEPELPV